MNERRHCELVCCDDSAREQTNDGHPGKSEKRAREKGRKDKNGRK